jgi:hypothetical protein
MVTKIRKEMSRIRKIRSFPVLFVFLQETAEYAKIYAKYAKSGNKKKIRRIHTPPFADAAGRERGIRCNFGHTGGCSESAWQPPGRRLLHAWSGTITASGCELEIVFQVSATVAQVLWSYVATVAGPTQARSSEGAAAGARVLSLPVSSLGGRSLSSQPEILSSESSPRHCHGQLCS